MKIKQCWVWIVVAVGVLVGCGDDGGGNAMPSSNGDVVSNGTSSNGMTGGSNGTSSNGGLPFDKPEGPGHWILVDNIHSVFQNPDKKAFRGNYQYDGMHGYHRLFRHLSANGYPYRQIFSSEEDMQRLTPEILDGFKVLFINLLTRERPDFTASEVEAIHGFVREGGGLFVIADHTNVYRHAERLNPWLKPMGVEVDYSTAADTPQFARGGYWLEIRHFDRSSPLVEGVDFAAWQTGAALVTDHGFAFTSPDGFADFWNLGEESDPGYYGDGRYNPAGAVGLCQRVCSGARTACAEDSECPSGETCGGLCISTGEACMSDAMCGAELAPVKQGCVEDSECSGEQLCLDSLCRPMHGQVGLPIMAATTFGEGRLVVVGDQNIFGDEWLFVGNNFELSSNIFEWLAKDEDAQTPLRTKLEERYTVVGFDLNHSQWNIAVGGCDHFFPFFINFNRTENVAGRGIEKYTGAEDVLVLPDPKVLFSPEEVGDIRAYLQDGKTVVLMADVVNSQSGSHQLIRTFIPDVRFMGSTGFGPDDLPANDGTMVEIVVQEEAFEVSSPLFDVAGLRMSGHLYPQGATCPYDIEQSKHTMRKLTVEGGSPLLQATVQGETSDLARIFEVDGGRLVVFFQDSFWRNETLGWELQFPTPSTADAHEVEYAFIDWLIAQTPGGQ